MEKAFSLPEEETRDTGGRLPEGRNAPDAEDDPAAAAKEPSREEKFTALITGEYKDLFERCVEDAVNAKSAEASRTNIAEKAARRYEKWLAEAREARECHSAFDLSRELKNEQFCELLKCGVPVKSAYELRQGAGREHNKAHTCRYSAPEGIGVSRGQRHRDKKRRRGHEPQCKTGDNPQSAAGREDQLLNEKAHGVRSFIQ